MCASARRIGSLDEVRSQSDRLEHLDDEQMKAMHDEIIDELAELSSHVTTDKFSEMMDFREDLIAAVSKSHNADGIYKELHKFYNPYIHTSLQMLNDQFAKAWRRPNMVVVKCEILKSDADTKSVQIDEDTDNRPYTADGAKNSIGSTTEWNNGPVSKRFKKKPRTVVLTQYCRPIELVSMDEYAKSVKKLLEDNEALEYGVPFSHVTPEQRDALYAAGVPITAPEGSGKNAKSMAAYNEWKGEHPTNPTGTDDDIYAMARKAKEARLSATHKLSAEYESDKSKLVTIKNSIFDNYEKAFGRNNAGRRYTGNAVYGNSTRMVQAESDRRNIRMLEAKEASGRLEYSEDLQRSTERLESQRIIDTAKAVGLYVAPKNVANVGKQINHSKESIVYKSSLDDKAVVYKFKDPFAADNIKKHDARYAIFEHIAHRQRKN